MKPLRVEKINSLLREVISEAIRGNLKDPIFSDQMIIVTEVRITKDLRQAKVYVSVMLDKQKQKDVIKALKQASGFIGVIASKKVRLRFFPELTFLLDESAERASRIDILLKKALES